MRTAIRCDHMALRVFTRPARPGKFAALHSNPGNARLSLPAGEGSISSRDPVRAVRHFQRALRVWTRDRHRCRYAVARFNEAMALVRLASCPSAEASGDALRLAAVCYGEASACMERCGQDRLAGIAGRRHAEIRALLGEAQP